MPKRSAHDLLMAGARASAKKMAKATAKAAKATKAEKSAAKAAAEEAQRVFWASPADETKIFIYLHQMLDDEEEWKIVRVGFTMHEQQRMNAHKNATTGRATTADLIYTQERPNCTKIELFFSMDVACGETITNKQVQNRGMALESYLMSKFDTILKGAGRQAYIDKYSQANQNYNYKWPDIQLPPDVLAEYNFARRSFQWNCQRSTTDEDLIKNMGKLYEKRVQNGSATGDLVDMPQGEQQQMLEEVKKEFSTALVVMQRAGPPTGEPTLEEFGTAVVKYNSEVAKARARMGKEAAEAAAEAAAQEAAREPPKEGWGEEDEVEEGAERTVPVQMAARFAAAYEAMPAHIGVDRTEFVTRLNAIRDQLKNNFDPAEVEEERRMLRSAELYTHPDQKGNLPADTAMYQFKAITGYLAEWALQALPQTLVTTKMLAARDWTFAHGMQKPRKEEDKAKKKPLVDGEGTHGKFLHHWKTGKYKDVQQRAWCDVIMRAMPWWLDHADVHQAEKSAEVTAKINWFLRNGYRRRDDTGADEWAKEIIPEGNLSVLFKITHMVHGDASRDVVDAMLNGVEPPEHKAHYFDQWQAARPGYLAKRAGKNKEEREGRAKVSAPKKEEQMQLAKRLNELLLDEWHLQLERFKGCNLDPKKVLRSTGEHEKSYDMLMHVRRGYLKHLLDVIFAGLPQERVNRIMAPGKPRAAKRQKTSHGAGSSTDPV